MGKSNFGALMLKVRNRRKVKTTLRNKTPEELRARPLMIPELPLMNCSI